jgi:hypothetical protein
MNAVIVSVLRVLQESEVANRQFADEMFSIQDVYISFAMFLTCSQKEFRHDRGKTNLLTRV